MLEKITKELDELKEMNNDALAMLDEVEEIQNDLENTLGDIYIRAMELEAKRRKYFCPFCLNKKGENK